MSSEKVHYSQEDLVGALVSAGVKDGDVIFVHASLGRLGYPDRGRTMADACRVVLDGLLEAIGPSGTLLVPTYTYSIGKGEVFDVESTPSTIGDFTEFFRQQPGVIRSAEPMLSVAGFGPAAASLLTELPHTSYGPGSIYDRLHDAGGKLVMVGLGLFYATYRHYVEEWAGVPFRFKKLFTGVVRERGSERRETWMYSAAPRQPHCAPHGPPLERLALDEQWCRTAKVGRGEVRVIGAREYRALGVRAFAANPWLTAKGPPLSMSELVALEDARGGAIVPKLELPREASMEQMLDALAPLRRDIVSSGYDGALHALALQVPLTIHEYPSGSECFTWIVPERWTCREAWLETLDGRRLFSYEDHPLHVVSYSMPFEGVVTRDELLKHLHVHPKLNEAIPFVFKYYEKDWGLCCSKSLLEQLNDDQYRVVIRTEFNFSTLKVGELHLPGELDECVVICAHLCHPTLVADDLSGVVAGVEVFRRLQKRKKRRYSYKLLILPETIGSIAWLSRNMNQVPLMKGGLFLEMLSLAQPHALQLPFDENSEIGRCFRRVFVERGGGWIGKHRQVIGNDERQFNAPGVRVPMLSISRVLPPGDANRPFLQYHSSDDNRDLVSLPHLKESVELVMRFIDAWEARVVPRPKFSGEVFCSRYPFRLGGLELDAYSQKQARISLLKVLDLIDGRHSLEDIAELCGLHSGEMERMLVELSRHGLVEIGHAAR